MSCCGQGRAGLRSQTQTPRPAATVAPRAQAIAAPPVLSRPLPASPAGPSKPEPQAASSVMLRYLASGPRVVRGSVSGRAYHCAHGRPVQVVDARDAADLLQTGLFQRV
jgi:hypothetical protein